VPVTPDAVRSHYLRPFAKIYLALAALLKKNKEDFRRRYGSVSFPDQGAGEQSRRCKVRPSF
jgi:hypothetical protein